MKGFAARELPHSRATEAHTAERRDLRFVSWHLVRARNDRLSAPGCCFISRHCLIYTSATTTPGDERSPGVR